MHKVFQQYFNHPSEQEIELIKTAVIHPDFTLRLFSFRDRNYVVAESDHLPIDFIPKAIEKAFHATVEGWCTQIRDTDKPNSEILPSNSFGVVDINDWAEQDWNNYKAAVYQDQHKKFALLRVMLNEDKATR